MLVILPLESKETLPANAEILLFVAWISVAAYDFAAAAASFAAFALFTAVFAVFCALLAA